MKPTVSLRIILLGSSLLTAPLAHAADFYWDGGTIDIVTDGDGASDGGTGTWDTTFLNWDFGASPHGAWDNLANGSAIFGDTAGTDAVTLSVAISPDAKKFARLKVVIAQ